MQRLVAVVILSALFAVSCGSDAPATLPLNTPGAAAGSCLVGDPDCADGADGGAAGPLPDSIVIGDPDNPDAPVSLGFGGLFYSDGETSQLCSTLAESFPPQCGTVVIEIATPIDIALDYVAESFGNPDDAKINIEQGVYWTDTWINLTGTVRDDALFLE